MEVEELAWVPSLLAWIDRPFVVEEPDALRVHVRALAERLLESAREPGTGAATGGPGGREGPPCTR